MKIITEEELAMRLDFRRPLHPPPEETESAWCIPFEFGAYEKGTRISIPKAREIAATLLAAVAEAEKRELSRAFQAERARSENLSAQLSNAEVKTIELRAEIVELKRRPTRKASQRRSEGSGQ